MIYSNANCKKCGSDKVVRNGSRREKPCFLCRACSHQWSRRGRDGLKLLEFHCLHGEVNYNKNGESYVEFGHNSRRNLSEYQYIQIEPNKKLKKLGFLKTIKELDKFNSTGLINLSLCNPKLKIDVKKSRDISNKEVLKITKDFGGLCEKEFNQYGITEVYALIRKIRLLLVQYKIFDFIFAHLEEFIKTYAAQNNKRGRIEWDKTRYMELQTLEEQLLAHEVDLNKAYEIIYPSLKKH